ncbi:DNA methylase N-4/N-6 domain protein [Desulfurobacterium thermolithotrophum DSM 11699]|uniref:site-specific DNA-methyltransferase (adenine-specific) n=1 Tax=Desulfurobacterium thermolithotrophum (strain DSM 11699 / BSA) TaxID=868864 RepID=F0S321_DESTD|nr:site-specific DNA-methyltransferase [Desulfurobacterium thermolithotrophum]ADY73243.1 DNA methylase N-4/N-6 domain protein [Desulfurobacterium thermolithotrophum DSM 11699]
MKIERKVYEEKFWNILEDLFAGAEVEGKSGYVNLLKVKRKYFKNYLKPNLLEYIDKQLKDFPDFKEELYQKLYSFFHRYFSETGSIYFSYTPLYYKIYDKVYKNEGKKEVYFKPSEFDSNTDFEQILSDKEDVSLFWKTHMLYYIKTDKIIRSMKVEIPEEALTFYFDASEIELKKANEKKQLIYELKEVKEDGTIVLKVLYSERGKKTKEKEIIKQVKKVYKHSRLTEEYLNKAIKTFEKQANVDYFINKNAEKFLKEQFDLWMYQYLFSQEASFDLKRFQELQALKNIAYRIIEFIAQFEDELRKIWEKPRLVFNSNYVITLDRIANKEEGKEILEEIISQLKEQEKEFKKSINQLKKIKENYKSYKERFENHQIKNQLEEWYLLDIIEEGFGVDGILKNGELNEKWKFLPVDTKYFNGLKEKIEEIFDIDEELDGRLIKSENWQALNTILPKHKEKIQTIYIDPPFNKEQEADYYYNVNYKDSTWITMLENRISLAKELLNEKGSIFVRCDYNGNMYVRMLLNEIFGKENFRNEIDIKRNQSLPKTGDVNLIEETENLYVFGKTNKFYFINQLMDREKPKWVDLGTRPSDVEDNPPRVVEGKEFYPPKYRRWAYSQDNIDEMYAKGRLKIENGKIKILLDKRKLGSNWTDIPGYSTVPTWGFKTENSEVLLKRVIQSTLNERDIILDFFLGSGTTTAVAHKLKRKWIGVELGEHFYSVILPRMKKVLFYDKSGISKDKDVKELYNDKKAGGFFKYYELEQYEDILKTIEYADIDVEEYYEKLANVLGEDFKSSKAEPFIFDKKLARVVDEEGNINIQNLYPDKEIDIAESISNVLGISFNQAKENINNKTLAKLLNI